MKRLLFILFIFCSISYSQIYYDYPDNGETISIGTSGVTEIGYDIEWVNVYNPTVRKARLCYPDGSWSDWKFKSASAF